MITNPTAIAVSEEKSVPQEIARVSPCTPYRMKSTRSHRDGADRAGSRSRWIDSPPSGGRVAAATIPHPSGFVPALSTRTPDRRNKLTLPPSQIANPADYRKGWQIIGLSLKEPAVPESSHRANQGGKNLENAKEQDASGVRSIMTSIFHTRTRDKSRVTTKSPRIS